MAKGERVYNSTDAAGIKPKLVPNFNLMARDDSGGPEYDTYTAAFGDGEFKQGAKPHLSVSGGVEDKVDGDQRSDSPRTSRSKPGPQVGNYGPASSRKEQME